MRKAPRIGIIGLAGAGKDTLVDLIKAEFPELGLYRDRFAAPLKKAAFKVFGPAFDDRDRKEVEEPLGIKAADRVIEACIQLAYDLELTDDEEQVFQDAVFEQGWTVGARLSPRRFQQVLGTECVRKARKTAFVDRIAASAGAIIVPDCRFENETRVFNQLLLVIRPGLKAVADHPSEALATALTGYVLDDNTTRFDDRLCGFKYNGIPLRVVYNNGSIEDLRAAVLKLKSVL